VHGEAECFRFGLDPHRLGRQGAFRHQAGDHGREESRPLVDLARRNRPFLDESGQPTLDAVATHPLEREVGGRLVFGRGRCHARLVQSAPLLSAIEGASTSSGRALVRDRAVYLLLGANYHQAPVTNTAVKKALGVATDRNLTVIRAVVEGWC
jgi:hypothetical protein